MAYTRKMAGKVPVLKQDLVFDATPTAGSENAVTSGGVAEKVEQQSSNIAPNYTKKTYEANSYVMQGGVLYTNPNAIETAEDWNPAHWTQTTVDEAVDAAAHISDDGAKTESDLVDGALSIGEPNSVTKLTLTTSQTLTVLANEGVPNFALEIDNTGNSNGVTVTVKDSTGTNTLMHSSVAGATIAANTVAQITAVGNCWAFTYFED